MTAGVHTPASVGSRVPQIRFVLWVVLVLNWAVAFFKIMVGVSTRCMSMTADGVHSFSDGASNIVGLVGMSIAANPADRDHPYGHRKFETIAALVISFSLFFAASTVMREGVHHLFDAARPDAGPMSFAVILLTLGINAFTAWWERKKALKLKSDLLAADAWHTLSDVFVTLSVFVALWAIGAGILWLDKVISLGIGVFIAWIAVGILRRSLDVLSDHVVLEESVVHAVVMAIPGVSDCHEIRSRGRADDIQIDLHVLVNPKMSVEESHTLANLIERNLRQKVGGVTDVLVHIEPLHHDHRELEGPHHEV